MALGGRRRQVLALVIGQGMAHASLGVLAGVALAVPAAALVGSILYQVSPYDPLVFGAVMGVLMAAAWLGCWVPASCARSSERARRGGRARPFRD
jgi:putative ABC transport system permease protein